MLQNLMILLTLTTQSHNLQLCIIIRNDYFSGTSRTILLNIAYFQYPLFSLSLPDHRLFLSDSCPFNTILFEEFLSLFGMRVLLEFELGIRKVSLFGRQSGHGIYCLASKRFLNFSDGLQCFQCQLQINCIFKRLITLMCISQGVEGIMKYGKACRRIILMEDGIEVRNFVADIKQFTINCDTLVNLLLILKYLGNKGAALYGYQFQFVDQSVTVKSLEDNIYLRVERFAEHVITINRKPLDLEMNYEMLEETMEENKVSMEVQQNQPKDQFYKEESSKEREEEKEEREEEKEQATQGSREVDKNKKQKEKERQIKSAIECVKVWRGIYESSGHKISLISAAKTMGISKKSLDDYFLQLRLGELYGFDFAKNINKGIGVLRAHIKEKSNKELESKVPKNIKSFELVRDFDELKAILVSEKNNQDILSHSNPEGSKSYHM